MRKTDEAIERIRDKIRKYSREQLELFSIEKRRLFSYSPDGYGNLQVRGNLRKRGSRMESSRSSKLVFHFFKRDGLLGFHGSFHGLLIPSWNHDLATQSARNSISRLSASNLIKRHAQPTGIFLWLPPKTKKELNTLNGRLASRRAVPPVLQ